MSKVVKLNDINLNNSGHKPPTYINFIFRSTVFIICDDLNDTAVHIYYISFNDTEAIYIPYTLTFLFDL